MKINIDTNAGFCWGVVQTVDKVEETIANFPESEINILGEIIHNPQETKRLEEKGLRTISIEDLDKVQNGAKVIIRAHGEPPSTYQKLKEHNIDFTDATCPLVRNLQKKVSREYKSGKQVVIYGKITHPEVIGLTGVCENNAIVIQNLEDAFEKIDFSRPTALFSQTTMNEADFLRIAGELRPRFAEDMLLENNSVCKFVTSRETNLRQFARDNELIIFVAGRNSSNGKSLYNVCKSANSNIHFIESKEELERSWFDGISSVGITGATSTPQWYMNEVKQNIEALCGEKS